MDRLTLISLIDLEKRSLQAHELELERMDKLIKPKKKLRESRVAKYMNKI